jgi:molecular chaperone DnaJ
VTSSKGTGDLLAEVEVAVPARIPDAALAALKEFAAAMPDENPRAELIAKAKA